MVLQILEARRPELSASSATAADLHMVVDRLTGALLEPGVVPEPWPAFAERLRREYASEAQRLKWTGSAAAVSTALCDRLATETALPNDDPIQELFDEVVKVAKAQLATFSLPSPSRLRIDLKVVHCQLSPAEPGCPYVISAVTTPNPAEPLDRTVQLSIGPGQPGKTPILDLDSLLTIPYVIFHEVLSHVLRSPWTAVPVEDDGSRFQEGWMDFMALRLHEAYTRGAFGSIGSPLVRDQPGDCRYHAEGYSRSRFALDNQLEVHSQRAIGWAAAERCLSAIATARGGDVADAVLMELSLLINRSRQATITRDGLIGRINERLPFLPASPTKTEEASFRRLLDAMDRARLAADIGPILGELAALSHLTNE